MKTIAERLEAIQRRIHSAACQADRDPVDIQLVAVSKTQPASAVVEAAAAGLKHFGENRVQEAVNKARELANPELSWHLIGHLQRNKVRPAARLFHVIHSLDSVGLARALSTEMEREEKTMTAFLQVKLTNEPTKTGILPADLDETATTIRTLPGLKLVGLMTMPPFSDNPEEAAPYFRKLRQLRDRLNRTVFKDAPLNELSMGMTHDAEVAIREGATYIRIGTAIFGERYAHRQ